MDKFAKLFDRHRIVFAFALIAISVTAALGIAQLEFEDQPRGIFRTGDHSFQQLEQVFQQFGTDELNCMVVVDNDDLFTPRSLQRLRTLVRRLQDVKGVKGVISIADPRLQVSIPLPHPLLPPPGATSTRCDRARSEALSHPLVAGRLLTPDARKTLLIVQLSGDELTIEDLQPVVQEIRVVLDKTNQEGTLKAGITGLPSIRVDVFTAIQRDYRRLMWWGAAMAFLTALLIFRQFSASLIVFLASILGVLWIVGLMGLFGEKITVITTVLPTLVAVIGLTDAIHLMFEFRHQRVLGLSARESAGNTVRYLGIACGLTSLTTAIGFSSLATSHLQIIQRFGLACAVGALMVFASVMTLVPLLCGTGFVKTKRRVEAGDGRGLWTRCAEPLINLILRWRWVITSLGIVATICLAGFAMRLRPDSHLSENMPPGSKSVLVLQDVDRHFGGILTMSVVIQWPDRFDWNSPEVQRALDEVHRLMAEFPELQHPTSIRNFVDLLPDREFLPFPELSLIPEEVRSSWIFQELRRRYRVVIQLLQRVFSGNRLSLIPEEVRSSWIRPELKRLLVSARLQDRGIAQQTEMLNQFQKRLADLNAKPEFEEFELIVTGSSVVASENISQMLVDLGQSLGLATLVIFVVMVIAYRSLRLGLICLLPNILPLLITAAVIVISGGRLQIASVLVFTVCLGVAVDDTIHFVSRFQRELAIDQDVEAALRRTFTAVGAALLTSTLILLVGFSSSLASDLPHIRLFVGLSCVAIFTALLGDLLILPAMLACFYGKPVGSKKK